MKKLFTLMLAAIMLLTLAVPAFAADGAETGSITINGIGADSVYAIYQILDLESYNYTTGAYAYKVNEKWTAFFETDEAKAYVAVDDAGYVTWIAAEDDDTVATFAKGALSYAKANDIDPVQSSENGEMSTFTNEADKLAGKFENLELGWYLLDSNLGALCGLTTTNPNASVNAKNGAPTIDKAVQEDSTQQWGDVNSADIGQIVNFRTTINVHAGAENYILHDVMSETLEFKGVSKVEHIVPGSSTTTELQEGVHYNVVTGADLADADCTFEVTFTKAFCDSLETNDKIVVYYEAMLLRGAIIAGQGNTNEATLEYGEEHTTTTDQTKTYTYKFDIVKTDSQNTLIDGAKFKIYDAATGGNEIAVVLMDDGVTYRRARADETGVEIEVKGGQVTVIGFDNGTYYLEETVAPAGYNKLTARQKFIISDENLEATFNDGVFSTGSGVHVVNKTGTMLPETGGMGTVIFVTVGAVVMLACGVLLFTKKRMSQIAE